MSNRNSRSVCLCDHSVFLCVNSNIYDTEKHKEGTEFHREKNIKKTENRLLRSPSLNH